MGENSIKTYVLLLFRGLNESIPSIYSIPTVLNPASFPVFSFAFFFVLFITRPVVSLRPSEGLPYFSCFFFYNPAKKQKILPLPMLNIPDFQLTKKDKSE